MLAIKSILCGTMVSVASKAQFGLFDVAIKSISYRLIISLECFVQPPINLADFEDNLAK